MLLLRKFKNKIIKKYSYNLLTTSFHNDVYLVEFPKSGVTWLSFLIGNINLMLSGMDVKMTFFNQHQYIMDIHQIRGNTIREKTASFPPFRFIKSHEKYNKSYFFVIYLIRNPFDVMVSYFIFMGYMGYKGTFNDFIRDDKYGIDAWKEHLNSWLNTQDDAQSFMLIKYEDLRKNPKKEIEKIYNNLGVSVNEEMYLKAIEYSNFESMKTTEEYYRKFNPRYKMVFVRKGKVNAKEELMSKETFDYIKIQANDILEKFYPEYLEATNR